MKDQPAMKLVPTDKTALVTHRNCLDGTGSAYIFVMAGGKRENIFFKTPNDCRLTAAEAEPFSEVWFVDVCPRDLNDPAGGKPWMVIDHHDTNVRLHCNNANCIFNKDRCGTSLLAELTGQRTRWHSEQLIDAIENYDLGRFDVTPHTTWIADIAASYSQSVMLDMLLNYGSEMLSTSLYFQNRADAVGEVRELWAEQIAKNAYAEEFAVEFDGRIVWCAIAVAPMIWKNTVANLLMDGRRVKGRVPDFVAIVDYGSNSISLRSPKGGLNVAKIAESYGGGGHPHAAGIRFDPKFSFPNLFQGIFA